MTTDLGHAETTDAAADPDALVDALRPRLADLAGQVDVDVVVRETLADFGPVRVTTYLPILVERKVRSRVRGDVLDLRPHAPA